jgi:oligopeptide transport system substrate-binding protein
MYKKRWLILISFVLVAGMVLAACSTATEAPPVVDEEAQARIAELEAALEDAKASGGMSEEQLADLQSELEGLNENLGQLEGELSEARTAECSYNAYRMGWVMDWADAGNMVDTVFGPTSDFQYTFWQHNYPDLMDQFTALTHDAYRNTDLVSRATTWQEAEKIVVEDIVAVIPIFHYDRTTLVSTELDFFFAPFGAPRLAQWAFNTGVTEMRTAVGAKIPTLDIQRSTDTTSSFMIYQMIDAPFKFLADGSIAPLAATSFETNEEGNVYTVHLREDALWSDGEPVVAQHFVDGIKRLLSPDLANDYAYVMFDIVGAADYNAGDADDIAAVRAVDDYTLEITLTDPLSYFDSILAFSTMHPVRLDVIALHGDAWTQPGNMVSNGAYVLTERNPGQNLVFEKNELYWDAANVAIDKVTVSIIEEPATALAAFENGELDYNAAGFPPEDTSRLVDTPEFVLTPRPGVYYMGLNTTAAHTNNVTFRKALASAIDKRAILDNVAELPWRLDAYGVIPPEIYGFQGDAVGYGYDPDAAVGYLEQYMNAEGIDDAGSIVIELWYNKSGSNQEILEAVEAMWQEVLSIDVRTVNVEWATYLNTLEECNVIGGGGF